MGWIHSNLRQKSLDDFNTLRMRYCIVTAESVGCYRTNLQPITSQ